MASTTLLLGSAPVGPTTVQRLTKYAGALPTVRFGSTETCLQVLGTPLGRSEDATLASFRAGWAHKWAGEKCEGYYIGRPHPPHKDTAVFVGPCPLPGLPREPPSGQPRHPSPEP